MYIPFTSGYASLTIIIVFWEKLKDRLNKIWKNQTFLKIKTQFFSRLRNKGSRNVYSETFFRFYNMKIDKTNEMGYHFNS